MTLYTVQLLLGYIFSCLIFYMYLMTPVYLSDNRVYSFLTLYASYRVIIVCIGEREVYMVFLVYYILRLIL